MIPLPECPSTSTWALERLDALAHGACVWTGRQTAGRGRNGATWHSPPGVLTASFVLDLGESGRAVPATLLSLAAGLAVAHAVEDLVPAARVALKWPNDCLIAGRKLAGVLTEARERGDGTPAVVIGVGLNLAPRWEQDARALPLAAGKAAPIGLDEVAAPPAVAAMLAALRRYLLEACGLIAAGGWPRLLLPLRARDALAGRRITVHAGGATLTGTGDGLDDGGALRLRLDDRVQTIASGSVLAVE